MGAEGSEPGTNPARSGGGAGQGTDGGAVQGSSGGAGYGAVATQARGAAAAQSSGATARSGGGTVQGSGGSAPAEYLTKLTYLIWNHHEEIQHIDTVRAYTFGTHYFMEVDVVLPK